MGNHRNGRRTLAGFFGLTAGIVILFGAVAVAALRPTDGLAWVQVPDLSPDLGLDAGLRTKPLKNSVVAEAVKDRALEGSESLAVVPVLTLAGPAATLTPGSTPVPGNRPVTPPAVTPSSSPSTSPSAAAVTTASAAPSPAATPAPTPGPTPTPTPAPAPTPTPTPAPTPTPTPAPTPTPTPAPTPTPTPAPTPTPTPAPKPAYAIVFANETVAHFPNQSKTKCAATTVTAFGTFKTNGVGGWISYKYVRIDVNGNRVDVAEAPIWVAPGDTNLHFTVLDTWTPKTSGSEQLVFLSPTSLTATGQSWTCAS